MLPNLTFQPSCPRSAGFPHLRPTDGGDLAGLRLERELPSSHGISYGSQIWALLSVEGSELPTTPHLVS